MAPRIQTIEAVITKAIAQIEADRCAFALRTLQSLESKLNHKSKPKQPNAYAAFVKEQYKHFQSRHPGLSATELMPLIAKAWNEKKAASGHSPTHHRKSPTRPRSAHKSPHHK